MSMSMPDESTYRRLVDETFQVIDAAFDDVDPDVVESAYSQGTLTLQFADGKRCILSPQAPVRQIWVAFKDRAWHMNLDPASGRWVDDRGQNTDLYRLVEEITKQAAGLEVPIGRDRVNQRH
jgi:CyaY protein